MLLYSIKTSQKGLFGGNGSKSITRKHKQLSFSCFALFACFISLSFFSCALLFSNKFSFFLFNLNFASVPNRLLQIRTFVRVGLEYTPSTLTTYNNHPHTGLQVVFGMQFENIAINPQSIRTMSPALVYRQYLGMPNMISNDHKDPGKHLEIFIFFQNGHKQYKASFRIDQKLKYRKE